MVSDLDTYNQIRSGNVGFYEQYRGLISIWGQEAVQFLDGMITNDMKTLEDGNQMLAAFPNAQGRLLAVVRVLRQGDRFLFETDGATREKVYQNLFRFTFAGDFFVEDLTDEYRAFEMFGSRPPASAGGMVFDNAATSIYFIPHAEADDYGEQLANDGAIAVSADLYETLRIENGVPKYGVDMDETTVVPELGLDGMISYNKGCYIGQEIIARIHFRGHVAKKLTGVVLSEPGAIATGFSSETELTTQDGKKAGRVTSATYSPKLERTIGLAFVRYDHLAEGTVLMAKEMLVEVKILPFID